MKKISSSQIMIVAAIVLFTACQKNSKELSPNGAKVSSEQELYMPSVNGKVQEFTVKLSSSNAARKVSTEVKEDMVIMEGDIILGNVHTIEGTDASAAVAIDGASYRWASSIIPYVITAGHPKKADIEWAINHVNTTTNLCLVPRSNETNYIQFVSGSGCASYVGKQGGRQDITIGSCSPGSIAHEILHSAGLWHEQSREDRDSYITINLANIESGKAYNFDKHVSDGIDIGTYDYGSIMHYPKDAFSKNGANTINVKMPPGTASTVIGQRTALSTKDIQAINSLYAPGPCKEDCISINPANVVVKQSGSLWLVMDGIKSMFSAPVKAEADQIVKIIKYYGITKSCYVGRPDPSFQYLLKGSAAPIGSMAGEDALSFNPAALTLTAEGSEYVMKDGASRMFMFPNKTEADMALSMINKYGFNKSCYVGRPGPSLQYMRK